MFAYSQYYTISKEFHFSAAHQLNGLPPEHQCSRLHGHNYRVIVELATKTLDETGFIVDYGDLKPFGDWIDEEVDHRNLNEVFPSIPTTAETLAKLFAYKFVNTVPVFRRVNFVGVTVCETPKTTASFTIGSTGDGPKTY